MPESYVALDLETTGLSLDSDVIIEVGATRFDRQGAAETFTTFINPGRPIPPEIRALTGISDADVASAPRFHEVAVRLQEFIGDRAIVGQNIAFDLAFLAAERIVPSGPSYDTWELASVLLPTAHRLNLGSLAEAVGVKMSVAHRALSDAEATRDIFLALLDRLEAMPRSVLLEVRIFAERAGWRVTRLIDDALERRHDAPPTETEVREILARMPLPPSAAAPATLTPNIERAPVTALDVDALFAAAAARTDLFPGYERRPGQEEMSRAVAGNLGEGGHLAVEAGTGTGKSLAYLLPALLHALRNNDRVVVSTHTLNLQDQLATKDLPLASAIVEGYAGVPEATLRTALLKGRANYLCLERWAAIRLDPSPCTEPEARLFARIAAWLPETETGERGELYMTSPEQPAWDQVSAGDTDCLAGRCAYVRDGSCFLLRARQRAAAAHVVVANHSLLLANAARGDQVLPPFRHLILDEAHRLEDVATQHYGATLSLRELRDRLDALGAQDRHGAPGLARRVQGLARGPVQALAPTAGLAPAAANLDTATTGAREHVRELVEAVRRFIDDQEETRAGSRGGRSEVSLTSARRTQPAWEDVEGVAVTADMGLAVTLERLGAIRDGLAAIEDAPEVEVLRGEVAHAAEALAGARDSLRRTVLRPDRDDIAWVTSGDGDVRLNLAPLEVSGRLAVDLYGGRDSVMVTSATLTAAGSFEFAVQRLGLGEPRTLEVPSPYDYRRAVLVLVATDLPEPGMPGYDRAVQETLAALARAAQGRTLGLFTSHQAVRSTANALREPLQADDLTVLAQGVDGSPARLLRLLMERPRTLLLGTAAFWEGIDVQGEALSQIAVARLPFPVPSDPVYAGRAEQFDSPFDEFALPQSVLRFRQGFGRLIRGSKDRGVFVVLDSRITRREYGPTFLDALPDCEVRRLRADDMPAAVARWLEPR
ncbi:MAG: exonuclease [Chloroflexi bacterium]|nr:exonuclease [Chloroflexota bacterium]